MQSDQHKVAPCMHVPSQNKVHLVFLKKHYTLYIYLLFISYQCVIESINLFLKFCTGTLEVLPDVFKRETSMAFKVEYV